MFDESWGQILIHPTDPGVAGGESRATQHLKQIIEFLPLAKGMEKHRIGPHVHGHRTDSQEVG